MVRPSLLPQLLKVQPPRLSDAVFIVIPMAFCPVPPFTARADERPEPIWLELTSTVWRLPPSNESFSSEVSSEERKSAVTRARTGKGKRSAACPCRCRRCRFHRRRPRPHQRGKRRCRCRPRAHRALCRRRCSHCHQGPRNVSSPAKPLMISSLVVPSRMLPAMSPLMTAIFVPSISSLHGAGGHSRPALRALLNTLAGRMK